MMVRLRRPTGFEASASTRHKNAGLLLSPASTSPHRPDTQNDSPIFGITQIELRFKEPQPLLSTGMRGSVHFSHKGGT